jgi:transposase
VCAREEVVGQKYQMLKSELNERQRRLWAASEAKSMGYGGISAVARATGISRPTITKGIKELENNEHLPDGRIRREGGGNKKLTDTQPGLLSALDALVEPTAKGDPMSPLRWTTKSTSHLSQALNAQGYKISSRQVCQLLHELGYQLSANRKELEGGTHPDRNTQFEFINAQTAKLMERGIPVISVDAKKKELIGPC